MAATVGQRHRQRQTLGRIVGQDENQLTADDVDVEVFRIGREGAHPWIGARVLDDARVAELLEIGVDLIGH